MPSQAGHRFSFGFAAGFFCHRYSSATCPNRRRTCLLLNLPISKSVVRLNATEPAWPNTFQSPCAQSIAAAGLGQSIGSPAVTPPSMKSKGKATKEVISVMVTIAYPRRRNLALQFDSGCCAHLYGRATSSAAAGKFYRWPSKPPACRLRSGDCSEFPRFGAAVLGFERRRG